ncbi:MAG TPA: hypothetical protein V6D10_03445 [Trichocoleus sp.]|jgi:hypothetical protein
MALQNNISIYGIEIPAYSRIGALYFNGGIAPQDEYEISFRVDSYPSQGTYVEGKEGAAKSQNISIYLSPEIDADIQLMISNLFQTYSEDELKALAFGLIRTLGYEAIKSQPEFVKSIDL